MFNFGGMQSRFPQMKFPNMPQMGHGLQPPQMGVQQAAMQPQMQAMGPASQQGFQMPGQFLPHMQGQMMGQMQGGFGDFRSALQDWRGAMRDWRDERPEHMQGMDDFRQQKMDWRDQRPERPDMRGMLPTFG